MNERRKRESPHGGFRSQLTRRLLLWYFLSLIAYAAILAGCVLIAIFFCTRVSWRPDDPLYQLLNWISQYIILVYGAVLLAGWLAITLYFLIKPLRYLEEVVTAAQQLTNPDERPIHLAADLKEIEGQLNQAREQALRSARLAKAEEQRKNDLIVYLAHDLKTPLTSVIGYLTLLQDEPRISPELRARYTGIALEKAQRLEELINEFFDITRFSLSHLTLERGRVDLALMLRQVSSEFGPMLADKGLTCAVDLPDRLDYECDGDKMARVFDNLLRNAVSYSYEGTDIQITGGWEETGLVLRFQNRGKTIPPEKLQRIFEQFFRLDSARASRTGGSGLGLAIAREIVELHGGTIQAASERETVTFSVTLPQTGEPEGTQAP